MTAFELAVQDLTGVQVAQALGVDRVELCTGLALGGLTPSVALIERAAATGVPVHVLLRPRAGGFDYSTAERALMVADARAAITAGAAGVVVGGTRDGGVDEDLVRVVREEAGEVTFHRAFDALADPERAVATLAGLGVRRVLTTGGGTRAAEALPALTRLVQLAGDELGVMAGGGIAPQNVAAVAATGVAAVHASAKRRIDGPAGPALGSADTGGYETTDESLVRQILTALGRGSS